MGLLLVAAVAAAGVVPLMVSPSPPLTSFRGGRVLVAESFLGDDVGRRLLLLLPLMLLPFEESMSRAPDTAKATEGSSFLLLLLLLLLLFAQIPLPAAGAASVCCSCCCC